MKKLTAAALCAAGAEKTVSLELKKLAPKQGEPRVHEEPIAAGRGLEVLESGYGRVRFTTDLTGLYRALFSLRAADRLLLEAGRFPAPDFEALFEGTGAIPWEDLVSRNMGLAVTKVRSGRSALKAETAIQAVVHKAAAARLCAAWGLGRLPEEGPRAELRVYLEKDEAQVYLDLCGDPLFKRGYRPAGGPAPLRESAAAAIILLSGWRRKFPLYDPLCGSGTIIIEAALYAWDIAPGLGRTFALSSLALGDRGIEAAVRRELADKIDLGRRVRICGSDADEKAVALAGANLRRAMAMAVSGSVSGGAAKPGGAAVEAALRNVSLRALPLDRADSGVFAEADSGVKTDATAEAGFIITNPPWGKRLGSPEEAETRYREMAGLGKAFPGWKLALICDHPGFESHFGRKAGGCRELKCGAVDAYLYQYEKL